MIGLPAAGRSETNGQGIQEGDGEMTNRFRLFKSVGIAHWLSFPLPAAGRACAGMYCINHWIPAFACLQQAGRNDNEVLFWFYVMLT